MINIINALLTPIIAVLAVYIAYQQYLTNKKISERQYYLNIKKLNFELYEKRYRIFQKIKKILHQINEEDWINIVELRDFKFNTNESKFLFDNKIVEYLKELQTKAINLSHSTEELNNVNLNPVNSQKRNELIAEKSILKSWFTYEYENVEYRFLDYFDFKKL